MVDLTALFAYRAGADAAQGDMQRVVPERWQKFNTIWLQGYDETMYVLRAKLQNEGSVCA